MSILLLTGFLLLAISFFVSPMIQNRLFQPALIVMAAVFGLLSGGFGIDHLTDAFQENDLMGIVLLLLGISSTVFSAAAIMVKKLLLLGEPFEFSWIRNFPNWF